MRNENEGTFLQVSQISAGNSSNQMFQCHMCPGTYICVQKYITPTYGGGLFFLIVGSWYNHTDHPMVIYEELA